ncbi:MAG: UDP-N-acetylmuramate--L-alanine ligase [Acidobacteria bacterium]|nr:UDP-N-acetylmuramate--L-alanine ligase [Acidobacteriota bacterium]
MFGKMRRVHFVGIGGIGMSGIAEVLLNLGFEVSGSDIRTSHTTTRLQSLGCRFVARHSAENVANADVVVVSSAITRDNIEVERAHQLQIPVIRRAEMLGELMRLKYAVTVAGSHGKTTTTSMISVLLHHCGLDPTIVIGGRLNIFGSNARLGQGPLLVAEADESDGSFLKLFPTIAVITNIDAEHMDFYGTMDDLKQTFLDYINRIPFYGLAILCLDDANVQSVIPRIERRYITYGFSKSADLTAEILAQEGGGSHFRAIYQNRDLGEFHLQVPGTYNILNSLSAIATGLELSLPVPQIQAGLQAYEGVDRRFQLLGEVGGVRVIDDYGHHPTEIRVTLEAARALSPRRVVAVFQPHRYSRVQSLWEQFSTAFFNADLLFCTEIYPAGEKPRADITGEGLYQSIRAHGHKQVYFEPDFHRLAAQITDRAAPGDMIITFGAGNIHEVGQLVLDRLKKEA